jgi:ubiquinol-cytochrome c reductase cytochrome b/c1 subunit
VAFTPYATIKDLFGTCCFLLFYAWFIFYMPNYLGDSDNYIVANPGVTPAHIVPEWYYLPFYAILRSIPNKLAGVTAMFSAILILAFLPWLDTAKTKSSKYRPLAKQFFWVFVVVCVLLGYLGAQPPEGIYVIAGRILTFCYFAYFLILLPLLSRIEKPRPLPNSIADDVLAKTGSKAAPMVSTVIALAVAGALFAGSAQNARAEEQQTPPSQQWSFAGPFGKYDRGALQRGLKVYKEVCSACHALSYIAFRNLADPGGPGYLSAQAAALAAEYKIKDGPNDQGEMFERSGRLADYFPSPFPNEQAARAANGGALPPDLSLIPKARSYERGFPWFIFDFFTQFQEQGPNYVDALLQGFEDNPPAGVTIPEGSYYNKYFPGMTESRLLPGPTADKIASNSPPPKKITGGTHGYQHLVQAPGRQGRERLSRQRRARQRAGRGRDPGVVGAFRTDQGNVRPLRARRLRRAGARSLQGKGGALSRHGCRRQGNELAGFHRRHHANGARRRAISRQERRQGRPDRLLPRRRR